MSDLVKTVDFSESKAALLKLVEDAVQKKPQTKEDAVQLFHALQVAIGPWLVSELPPLEQKAVLVGLWALDQVEMSGCFGFLKK